MNTKRTMIIGGAVAAGLMAPTSAAMADETTGEFPQDVSPPPMTGAPAVMPPPMMPPPNVQPPGVDPGEVIIPESGDTVNADNAADGVVDEVILIPFSDEEPITTEEPVAETSVNVPTDGRDVEVAPTDGGGEVGDDPTVDDNEPVVDPDAEPASGSE